MMKTHELLPCPFCGSKSVLVKSNEYRDDGVIEYPKCISCGAHSTNVKDDSIKEWNARVYPKEVIEDYFRKLLSVKCECGEPIIADKKICPKCGRNWSGYE